MRRANTGSETELEFNLKFVTQFINHPTKTGAILPSSDKLCELMTDMAELNNVSTVIEFGPGTGVITEKVMRKKSPDTTFFAMEINEAFVESTKSRCPDAIVYQSSAENASKYLEMHGKTGCDLILSSLPWIAFDGETQQNLLDTIYDVLNPGGKFLTYAYAPGLVLPASWRFRKKLNSKFDKVTKSRIIWSNIPPALVYQGEKA
jgi:phospholipid N-methyltransferase